MNRIDMAQKLAAFSKRCLAVNHQDNEFLLQCSRLIREDQNRIDSLLTEIADKDERIGQLVNENTILEERIAIMTEGAGELPWESVEAAAPGEAAEDFWEDDWPLGDQ